VLEHWTELFYLSNFSSYNELTRRSFMSKIVFVLSDDTRRVIDAAAGSTVMLTALQNDVRGIDGECGGCCSCATCHVYVEEAFADKLPKPDPLEREVLSGTAAEIRPTSRLGCQISVTPELDGLIVHVPPRQST
jgi:2Fe-2S ferredoxin